MSEEPTPPSVLASERPVARPSGAELGRPQTEQERLGESERRYRDLYDEAPTAYVTVANDARILSANRRASQLLGYSIEELVGAPLFNFFANTSATRARGAELCHRFAAGEEFSGLELEMRRKDGRSLWISLWMKPLRGDDGTIQTGRTIWVDITDRVLAEAARAAAEQQRLRAEQLLSESERRYRDFFEGAPLACLFIGVDGSVLSANRRAAEWLGYTREEMVGVPIVAFHADTPASKAQAAEAFRKFLAGEELAGVEFELRRKDGRPLWISAWMTPIREDGRIVANRSIGIDITDRVLAERDRARLQQQNLYLREEIKAVHNFEEIVGQGPGLAAVLDNVRRVAPTDTSVLITGESGTGKELIARALHSASKRQDKLFIKLSCAALPTGLVESELFGHERGAFSGAIARRIGRFELADGGTLFLDEVGEIPPEVQVKLLRVLQEREFERVGGSAPIKADVRVIAATNRDLLQAVRERTFREDLYYRLNVFPIHLPPLRERIEDIPLLVHFLVNKSVARTGKRLTSVSPETMHRLQAYPWPGNVRELENIVERAVVLAAGDTLEIGPDLLSAPGLVAAAPPPASLEAVERQHILAVLQQTDWVIDGARGAARILEIHPNTLRNRMKKLGLSRPGHQNM
jgi:PAS domain S-box-containing protein